MITSGADFQVCEKTQAGKPQGAQTFESAKEKNHRWESLRYRASEGVSL